MSYRFVKVTTYYREFVNQFYANHPEMEQKSYSDQHSALMKQGFFFADFYQKSFEKIGIEAHELVNNAPVLQNKWCQEQDVSASGDQIIVEQLKKIKPDVVMFQNSSYFNGDFIDHVRKSVPEIKLIIGFLCSPWPEELIPQFKAFDFLICCSKEFSDKIASYGMKSYMVQHAFSPDILPQIEGVERNIDFSFIGSIMPGGGFHDERKEIIEYVIQSGLPFQFYGNIHSFSRKTIALQQAAYVVANSLKGIGLKSLASGIPKLKKALALRSMPHALKLSSDFLSKSKAPMYGIDMLKVLAASKLSLNVHGSIAGAYAANMRLFEITGTGACILTDWKKNMADLFEPDVEAVVYKSAEECVDKAKYLLAHPEEMQKIGMAGQKRCLKDHTYDNRVRLIDEIIKRELK